MMAKEIDIKCGDVTVRVHADEHGVSFISGMTVTILPKTAISYATEWLKSEGDGFVRFGREFYLAHKGVRIPLTLGDAAATAELFKTANREMWHIK